MKGILACWAASYYIYERNICTVKIFMPALLFMIYGSDYAQASADTIYYDKFWKKTTSSDYVFYRIVNPHDDLYIVSDYYRNGHLQMEGTYYTLEPKAIKEGHFTYFTDGGMVINDEYYHEGLKEGLSMYYDSATHFTYKMHYKKGKLNDTLIGYYPHNVIRRMEIYSNDSLLSGHCYSEEGNEISFFQRQIMPEYPGGETALMQFIQDHLDYPRAALDDNIQGRVFVTFIVETDGTLSDLGIAKSVHPLLDKAAIKVVRRLSKFKPGQFEGKPIRVRFSLPINFSIHRDNGLYIFN